MCGQCERMIKLVKTQWAGMRQGGLEKPIEGGGVIIKMEEELGGEDEENIRILEEAFNSLIQQGPRIIIRIYKSSLQDQMLINLSKNFKNLKNK